MNTTSEQPLEIWGGVECTVARLRDTYRDQLELSGHATREDDLELFAELGLRALRYPVLWERTQPQLHGPPDWSWSDARLGRIRELGILPIVGLLHHGSGPSHTSLTSESFPDRLADFARATVRRYPWIENYTPVNEPLTTARFSGLYGHWYPHGTDNRTFARALVNQCRATVSAMRAIRTVNPAARLIQTEDLGKTHSTRKLAYQAEWENERRWLSSDLLTGSLRPEAPMWEFLLQNGIRQAELWQFVDDPCPPDILGCNYYVTSERYLSQQLAQFPAWSHGGNAVERYADVEAVRGRPQGLSGLRSLLLEAWHRYKIPIAITENHLSGAREAQLRWLVESWKTARRLRAGGVDIRALTVWSLLGAFDWNSLLTRCNGFYEPGAFDLRAPKPRPTAVAKAIKQIASSRRPRHPVLKNRPWWKNPTRLQFGPRWRRANSKPANDELKSATAISDGENSSSKPRKRPILIAGGRGTLGRAFARICAGRGLAHLVVNREEMDISDPLAVRTVVALVKPWALINAAGYVRVDQAESERERCYTENVVGPCNLARVCAEHRVTFMTFSSDLVFGGEQRHPYRETDLVGPLCYYGQTKAEADREILALNDRAMIVRTSAFFGPWDTYNFLYSAIRNLAAGEPLCAAGDQVVSPTYLPDLVNTCLDLLIDRECGVWHLANDGAAAWAELAKKVAKLAGLNSDLVQECCTAELGLIARRPAYSALGTMRGCLLPTLDSALPRFMSESEVLGGLCNAI